MTNNDNKYSYSKLDTYEGCPFKYKLQYVDKKSCFIGNIATDFGTLIHKTEENIGRMILAKQPIDYITLKNNLLINAVDLEIKYPVEYFQNDGKSDRNYRDKLYQYIERDIYRLETFLRENPTYELVDVESNFCFEYDTDHIFRGSIDRVLKNTETGQFLIQDIKSWAAPKDDKELTTPLQFVVYTWAAQQKWNLTADQIQCQYELPLVGITQNGGTKGYMDRGIKKIEKLFESIKNEEFKPNPSPLCAWCNYSPTNVNAIAPYKYQCPYFMKWTKDHKDFSKENDWQGMETNDLILEAYHKKYNLAKEITTVA